MLFFNHEHVHWVALFVTWNYDPRCFGLERLGLAFCGNGSLLVGARPNRCRGGLGLALCIDSGLMGGVGPKRGRNVLG